MVGEGAKLKLLVVDDESAMRTLLKQAFEANGHKVDVAENAERALEILAAKPVDLVLTDLRMDGLSGIDLLKKIVEGGTNTGVILISGFATLDLATEAMRLGAIDVVQKPLNIESLNQKIQDYARTRQPAISATAMGDSEKMSASAPAVQSGVAIQHIELPQMQPIASHEEPSSIDKILDIPVQATVRLGKATMQIAELLKLGAGSVIELDKHVGEPVELLVNNRLVAFGEVVVVNDTFGLRVTNIIDQKQRIQSLT